MEQEQKLDLDDRYGRKKSPLRFLPFLIFGALLIWLFWSGNYHSNPVVVSNLISFKEIDQKNMGIDFEITRRDPNQALDCRLSAIDINKNIVGEITYRVVAGERHLRISTKIPTRAHSVSASVIGCVPAN